MKPEKMYDRMGHEYHSKVHTHFYNAFLDLPATIKVLRDLHVKDKKVLDLGCGSGRYAHLMLHAGAKVWGIDPSRKLLAIAKKENPDGKFRMGKAEKIPFRNNFFDFVISGLAIHYVEDIDRALLEVNRVLKKGGIFVFSTGNPITEITEKIREGMYRFDNYFREGKRINNMPHFGVRMPYYHYTMESYMKAILGNGFSLDGYWDVKPIKNSKDIFPREYEKTMNKPMFCIFRARKN